MCLSSLQREGTVEQRSSSETLELEVAKIQAPVCRCGSGVEGKDEELATMESPTSQRGSCQ